MSTNDSVRRFFGTILVVVGVLFMVLCGGCAVLFSVMALLDLTPETAMLLWVPWLLAAVPLIAGWFMYRTGRQLMRPAEPPAPSGDAPNRDPA